MTQAAENDNPETPTDFGALIEELFRSVRGPNGQPYTAKAIVERANQLGYNLGAPYLSQLRTGKARSPSFRTIEAIAAAFDVDVHYFLRKGENREQARVRIELDHLQEDSRVRLAAFRMAGLSDESLTVVSELINVLRSKQGLDETRQA